MSIRKHILKLVNEKILIELRPRMTTRRKVRSLYLEAKLYEHITNEKISISDIERFANLEADLTTFLLAETISPGYMFGLSPSGKGVWEIRSIREKPSLRVFGMFAKKDIFIGTNIAARKGLGAYKSLEWKKEIRESRQIWNSLFDTLSPLVSENVSELFNGALDEQYFKK